MGNDYNVKSLNEKNISQTPAKDLLIALGYNEIKPEDTFSMRGSRSAVILKNILRTKLMELNSFEYKGVKYQFSAGNIEQAINDLDEPLGEGLITTNEKIYETLMYGKTYTEDIDTVKQSFDIKYIDWEHIENNVFHVCEEFRVERYSVKENARPDLVLFVNGIPFGVIECKKASVSMAQGIEQMIRNQCEDYLPQLFKYVQIVMSTNKNETMYATVGTPKKFWSVWQEEDIEKLEKKLELYVNDRTPTKQDKDIISLFSPDRLLDITRNFIIFDKKVKKIARYQQFFAIKEIIDTVRSYDKNGNRQSGVIWHTQGSGKSLTMVMLAKFMLTELLMDEPKIVVVTDRIDLDKQIRNTFVHSRIKTDRAESGGHLAELIHNNNACVITTLVNKFKWAAKKTEPNHSRNIFMLVDESHRSEYGEMYNHMKKMFPNACYLGFTGTPLMKKDKNTMVKFGRRLIHKYTITDGVRDKAILPLLYDGRMVDQAVNRQAIDLQLDIITRHLNKEHKEEVYKKWARYEKIASSLQRIDLVAYDINEHFLREYKTKSSIFKGMMAVNEKKDAVRYLRAFEALGDLNVAVCISSPDMREGIEVVGEPTSNEVLKYWNEQMDIYKTPEAYDEYIKDEFVNGDEIDLLIVVDKLLTGFDAPRASVLYIDKAMKEHTLLQAIARVNRLYEGKDYGLIVDYRGLLTHLDDAMGLYSGMDLMDGFELGDLNGAIQNVIAIIGDLRQAYSNLVAMFSSIDTNDSEALEVSLADEERRNDFYDCLSKLGRFLKIALSTENVYRELDEKEIAKYKKIFAFYTELRKSVLYRYSDSINHKEYENKMQKLMDNYIAAQGIIHITAPVDILDQKAFDEELSRLGSTRAKAEAMSSRMTKHISQHYDENPSYYKRFSQRIEEILENYRNMRLTDAELLERMRKTLEDLRNKADNIECPVILKKNEHARAFYGVIFDTLVATDADNLKELYAKLALDIDEIIDRTTKIDWHNNPDVHNKISLEIDDLLFQYEKEYSLIVSSKDVEKLIKNILQVALNRY